MGPNNNCYYYCFVFVGGGDADVDGDCSEVGKGVVELYGATSDEDLFVNGGPGCYKWMTGIDGMEKRSGQEVESVQNVRNKNPLIPMPFEHLVPIHIFIFLFFVIVELFPSLFFLLLRNVLRTGDAKTIEGCFH